jgi:hypothetical protein
LKRIVTVRNGWKANASRHENRRALENYQIASVMTSHGKGSTRVNADMLAPFPYV